MSRLDSLSVLGRVGRRVGDPRVRSGGVAVPRGDVIPTAYGPVTGIGGMYGASCVGTNLTGEQPEHRRRYREMLRDETVKSAVLQKVFGTATLTLRVKPDDKSKPRDREIAEFIHWMLLNAKDGVIGLTQSILFGAFIEGYSVSAKVGAPSPAARVPAGKYRGKSQLLELSPKDSDYFTLDVNEFRAVTGVRERFAGDADREPAVHDPAKFVIVQHLPIYKSPLGQSDFRAADSAYTRKNTLLLLRDLYLAYKAKPFILSGYSGTPSAQQVRAEMLALAAERGVAVVGLEEADKTEILSLATGDDTSFNAAIDRCEQAMATAITGGYLHMMAAQRGVQRGGGEFAQNVQNLFLWYTAALVSNALNDQVIPEYVRFNFTGNNAPPKAQLVAVDPAAIKAELEVGKMVWELGRDLSADQITEVSGWTEPRDDADRVPGKGKAEAEMAALGGGAFGEPAEPADLDTLVSGDEGEGEQGGPFDPALGDVAERAGLMADILTGLFGGRPPAQFAARGGGARARAPGARGARRGAAKWDPAEHPRGPDGRFIRSGTAGAYAAAKGRVAAALQGRRDQQSAKRVLEGLSILSVKQLHQLKAEYGIKASGPTKAALARKIADRLDRGRREAGAAKGAGKKAGANPLEGIRAKLEGKDVAGIRGVLEPALKKASKAQLETFAKDLAGYNTKGMSKEKVADLIRQHFERQSISRTRGEVIQGKYR